MKNQKNVLIFTLLVIIFLGNYYYIQQIKNCTKNNIFIDDKISIIENKEWTELKDSNLNYIFSYPSRLSRQKNLNDSVAFNDDKNKINDALVIRTYKDKQNLYNSVEDWYDRSQEKSFLWVRRVKIDGISAMVVRQRDFDKTISSEIIMVVKDDVLYDISLKGFNAIELDKFLENLKFLD